MIHAYSRMYLSDAEDCLASAFDYAVHGCHVDGDEFASLFVSTGYAARFGRGNPAVVAGMSGIELADRVFGACGMQDKACEGFLSGPDATAEYWAGWALAQYQWESAYSFRELFSLVPFSTVVELYYPYHETDVTHMFRRMDVLVARAAQSRQTRLALLRTHRGLSQRELSKVAGVGIKTIQSYEQRVNNINKAQVRLLMRLAQALSCEVESLLETEPRIDIEYDGR